MGILENIAEMQTQGLDEATITENLRQQGFSPKEIRDAYAQLRIRDAVSQEYAAGGEEQQAYAQEGYDASQAQAYQQYPGGYGGVSTEMVNEIVDQAMAERMAEVQKALSGLLGMKTGLDGQIKDLKERMEKVERQMEQLQQAVIGKIGDYGKDIKNIHAEMGAMQESFSKMLNPLTDAVRKMDGGKKEEAANTNSTQNQQGQQQNTGGQGGNPGGENSETFNFELLKKLGKG